MYEVEIKIRTDHEPVRDGLAALDAEPVGRVRQVDTYFDAPHRDFAATDEALRVRRESPVDPEDVGEEDGSAAADDDRSAAGEGTAGPDPTAELTYKGPKVDEGSKTRREVETAVANADDAAAIVEALGFEPAAEVRKTRDRYALGEYTVTLDDVDEVGTFVEVETQAADVAPAREGAAAVLADLGLDPAEQVRTSYLGLLLADSDAE